ncbi:insulinase family protein [Bowmanella dokdonensis]|uniref:Protease 3 n=1 Tax=Bowmanella dokdonensis TaxID=751969 RepID=A0A939DNW3_9ALTE|nr:insulinase family protein [Bowmanella dokdonensis]MBN7825246.1 insulinase family protein [Bowmanella dokdonensis]
MGIIRGHNDPARYQSLTMDNGLQVLLVSDNALDKAYASVSVAAGYFQDPPEMPGLAHLYEHMLSKGSAKYPSPGEYKAFLAANSGRSNASTSAIRTNYYFQVSAAAFPAALDRFAWQFIDPLLPASLIYRERQAVDAEFRLKFSDAYRRKREVVRQYIDGDHPYRKFSTGNLTTLRDQPELSLSGAINGFGQQHYCAQRMALVLAGPYPLSRLAKEAKDKFSALPTGCEQQAGLAGTPDYGSHGGKLIQIRSLRDHNRLTLSFIVGLTEPLRQMMATAYLEWLFDSYNPNGLEAYLQQQGIISSMNASQALLDRQHEFFNLEFRLTSKGGARQDELIAATFDYLDRIRQQTNPAVSFSHFATLQLARFNHTSAHPEADTVRRLADKTLFRPTQHILTDGQTPTGFYPQLFARMVEEMQPDSLLLIAENDDFKTDRQEPIYGTGYAEQAMQIARRDSARPLALPGASPYVVGRTPHQASESKEHEKGDRACQTHRPGTVPGDPFRSVSLYLDVGPLPHDFAMLNPLFAQRLRRQLRPVIEGAEQALIGVEVETTPQGLSVGLSGREGNWSLLFTHLLAALAAPQLDDGSLRQTLRSYRAELAGFQRDRLSDRTSYWLNTLLGLQPDHADRLAYMDRFDEQQYRIFVDSYLRHGRVRLFYYGEVDTPLCQAVLAQLRHYLPDTPVETAVTDERWVAGALRTFYPVSVSGPDSAARLMLLPTDDSAQSAALVRMMEALLAAPFFHQLRTQEQLGYSVSVRAREKYGQPYLSYYVQSDKKTADALLERIRQFNQWAAQTIRKLDSRTFTQVKSRLGDVLKEPYLNSHSASARLRHHYQQGRPADYPDQLALALREMDKAWFVSQGLDMLEQPLFGVLATPGVRTEPTQSASGMFE